MRNLVVFFLILLLPQLIVAQELNPFRTLSQFFSDLANQIRSIFSPTTEIVILHYNDIHSRVEPANRFGTSCRKDPDAEDCYGGQARQKTKVDEIRSKEPNVLVLDAGDQFMGTLWNSFYQGDAAVALQNMIGIDVMELGNHEFDYGEEVLVEYLKQANFPIVGACNIKPANKELAQILKKYTVKVVGGIRVGIIGVIAPETKVSSNPSRDTEFLELVPSLTECIVEMKQQQPVDVIIILSHSGFFDDQMIAREVEGIDLVIGGHSHTFLYTPPQKAPILGYDTSSDSVIRDTPTGQYPTFVQNAYSGKVVPVVQAYYASRYLGYLKMIVSNSEVVKVESVQGNPILLNASVPFDPEAQALIDELKGPLIEYGDVLIGLTEVFLEGDREIVRFSESNLGNSIADGFVWYVKNQLPEFEEEYGETNIGLLNGGNIRTSISKGNITVTDVEEVLPFGNVVSIKGVTGEDLIGSLEHGVSRWMEGFGGFPQIAGVNFAFNPTLTVGQRVVSVQYISGGEPQQIEPCKVYNVVTNQFIAEGGDGYDLFARSETLFANGPVMATMYETYIKNNTPINPKVEGRIINCEQNPDAPLCSGEQPVRVCSD
eukprot:TRINITY_DN264_c1_g1_i1.p1 TRINITY_DN264_c1_g1~~TRINITY_DN264_c1_g1_i1.p1  ORF type:complete len:658 (+),score=54.87 TRINITY_DN264_c1_g1_i1:169-1974(+)